MDIQEKSETTISANKLIDIIIHENYNSNSMVCVDNAFYTMQDIKNFSLAWILKHPEYILVESKNTLSFTEVLDNKYNDKSFTLIWNGTIISTNRRLNSILYDIYDGYSDFSVRQIFKEGRFYLHDNK